MTLLKHINSEKLLAELQRHNLGDSHNYRPAKSRELHSSPYLSKYATEPIPKFRIPEKGIEGKISYQLIKDDLYLDGTPALNLASFVNTYIDPTAEKLVLENLTKNLADNDEYPALMSIHERCISIIAHLWNVPQGSTAVGTATTGSSEAIHLGGLAMKRRWEARQKAAGRPFDKPNILMGANAQVALEKFARYFDVEARILDVNEGSRYHLDTKQIEQNLDENTIGIFVILGSTYTGHYEDVQEVSNILDKYQEKTGFDIPIHVDGASGAFVAPFVHPNTVWDFRLDRVKSINTSGHKFGLATAGLGWILWKDISYLPENLVFVLKYLGGDEQSYTLNFSRPGYQVIHQYYNLITLGFEGYKNVHNCSLANARLLSNFLEATEYFDCVSDIHRPKGVFGHQEGDKTVDQEDSLESEEFNAGLPVVAFKFSDKFKKQFPEVPQAAIASLLRAKGYIIPNYPLPPASEDIEILRVVVRFSLSADLLDRLMEDITKSVDLLIRTVRVSRKELGLTAEQIDSAETQIAEVGLNDIQKQTYKTLLTLVSGANELTEHESFWASETDSDSKKKSGIRSNAHSSVC